MVQQVNIQPLSVTQRHQQLVTGGIHVVTRFDTGKVLVLSSSVAFMPGTAGVALPSASAVDPGFFMKVLLADGNSWAVVRAAADLTLVPGEVTGNLWQDPNFDPGGAPMELPGRFASIDSGGLYSKPSPGGALEIYSDGVSWYIEGLGAAANFQWAFT